MSLHNIPPELRARPQWVIANDDKVPRNPRTGNKADPTDPATWGTFEEATQATARHVGYVLHKDDPYSAIDLDSPLTPEQAERHSFILEAAESYAEVSQSGNGVHIFVRGKIAHGVRRDKVEVYSDGRYMIMTGNVLNALPIADQQELLDVLFREMSTTGRAELVEESEVMTDEEMWEMGHNAENGEKFDRLWVADMADYPSQSEADFALMAMLCYYSKSNEQCRRVFRMSGLGKRDKAQRNRYLDYMIEKCRAHEPPKVDLEAIRNQPLPEDEKSYTIHRSGPVDTLRATADTPTEQPDVRGGDEGAGDAVGVEPIVFPPGLVGEIADYTFSTSTRPVKEISLVTALALAAGICGRSYNVSGTGLNQYLLLLAKTGSGKEGIASAVDQLVGALRPSIPMVDRFIGPAAFASGQALIRVLDKHPCFVSILGEFGTTLHNLCDEKAGPAEKVLKKVILDLYNKSGFSKVVRPSVYSDSEKNTQMVHAPNVSILGESTPEELYNRLTASHVTSGLLPRFSIIEYNGPRPKRNRGAFHPPSDGLLNGLGNLVTIALTTHQNRTFCAVQIDAHAQSVLDELDDYADEQINGNSDIDRELWNRAHLKALKMSSLIAVGCNPQAPVVDKEMAEWVRDFVFRDVQAISERFAKGDVGEGQGKQEVDIRRAMADYRKLTKSQRAGYKVPDLLQGEPNIVPFHYLRRRLRMCASFTHDRRGFAGAVENMLEHMVKAEILILVDRRTATETYNCSQPLYAVGATF